MSLQECPLGSYDACRSRPSRGCNPRAVLLRDGGNYTKEVGDTLVVQSGGVTLRLLPTEGIEFEHITTIGIREKAWGSIEIYRSLKVLSDRLDRIARRITVVKGVLLVVLFTQLSHT